MRVRVYTGKTPYYCSCWDNNAIFLTDSQDLAALRDHLARPQFADITGAFVEIENGDYSEIYVTWSNHPHKVNAPYYEVTIKHYP